MPRSGSCCVCDLGLRLWSLLFSTGTEGKGSQRKGGRRCVNTTFIFSYVPLGLLRVLVSLNRVNYSPNQQELREPD